MSSDHMIYFNSAGVEIPSVTTVLKIMNNHLDGWANYMGLKGVNTRYYVQERAERGTYIHEICSMYFLQTIPENFIADETFISQSGYEYLIYKLDILKKMLYDKGYDFYASELALSCDTFGGTMDIVFYNKEKDDYLILDFKTSKNVYHKYYIQLAGYTMLFRDVKHGYVRNVGVVLIDKDIVGKDFITIRPTENNVHNEKIFKDFLDIYYTCDQDEMEVFFK